MKLDYESPNPHRAPRGEPWFRVSAGLRLAISLAIAAAAGWVALWLVRLWYPPGVLVMSACLLAALYLAYWAVRDLVGPYPPRD